MPRTARTPSRPWPAAAALAMTAMTLVAAVPATAWADPQQGQKRSSDADFPSLEAIERDLARLVERTRPYVVSIVARTQVEKLLRAPGREIIEPRAAGVGPMARRVGSGVVIDADGHVATLSSVVSGAAEIVVVPADGSRRSATIRGVDYQSGLAVLAVQDSGQLIPVPLASADPVKIGSFITAFGNPQVDASYSVGFVAGRGVSHGPVRRGPYLQLSAYAAPGAGGGPVVDSKGRLVGIVFGGEVKDAAASPAPWTPPDTPEPGDLDHVWEALHPAGAGGSHVSYAIPVDVVRRVTDQIIRSGSVRRGWVGVTIESPEPGEIRLARVVSGGPADRAGLRPGDLIVAVDGEAITTAESLVETINVAPPETRITLGIRRGESTMQVPLVLGSKPQQEHPARPMGTPRPGIARLGVVLVSPSDELSVQRKAPEGTGLLVQEVMQGSRAQKAGLEEGDLILEALGIKILGLADMRRALREQEPSSDMELRVIRADGKEVTLLVPPPPAPPRPPYPTPAPAAPRQRRPPSPH